MYCAHCGTPCRDDEVFCAHCGAALRAEGGRVEENLSTAPAPAVENPVEEESSVPAVRERRFSLRLPRLSRRNRLLLGGCGALVVLLAVLAVLNRPAEGFQAKPAALRTAWAGDYSELEYFYYNGTLVAGLEEGLVSHSLFLDGESCLAMNTEGVLEGVVTADGLIPLNRPDGTMTASDPAADGSVFYCALSDGTLWRCPLSGGEPEKLVEDCPVDAVRSSPSGDAVAYFDRNAGSWYLLRGRGAPEELPLSEEAAVYVLSDDGHYVYYSADSPKSTYSSIYCWDGAASHLVGYTESFGILTNRTGDQLFLGGNAMTYLVDGTRNWSYSGLLYPAFLFQLQSSTAGIYSDGSIAVLDCADLSKGFFLSRSGQELYRLDRGTVTPVLEDFEQMLLDASGEIVWYVREGQLWRLQNGRSALQWDDPGSDVQLQGVSPDGETLVYGSSTGLWRLKAGGEPEQLAKAANNAYPYWNGFYYTNVNDFWYAPWDGEPEHLEAVTGISSFSNSSAIQVALNDGSIWHLIDGVDPIPVTDIPAPDEA